MKLLKGIVVAISLLGVLYSCSPLKKIESAKTAALATYANGNYPAAYQQLLAVISSYKSADLNVTNDLLLKVAECAIRTNSYADALKYYEQSLKNKVTVEAIKGSVTSIKNSGDKNKLNEVLSTYANDLIKSGNEEYLVQEQFELAVNSTDNKMIKELYPKLKSPTEKQSMTYLSTLETEGQKKEALAFCNGLVKNNPSYTKAKEWKAIYYYNIAEEAYKAKMAKYNKNKTYTAYVYLKRDLKKVSANFRIAKDIFEGLRKDNPSKKKYIKYLKNIYLRLDMKRETSAMKKLL